MKDMGETIVCGIIVSIAATVIWREMQTGWWRTQHYYGRISRKVRKVVS